MAHVFLTTDHPNGAPFYFYPHLIRLLMDRGFRNDMLQKIHPDAQAATILPTIQREYTLYDVAILTRAGPAKSLGLRDRVATLGLAHRRISQSMTTTPDREAMFKTPVFVFKKRRAHRPKRPSRESGRRGHACGASQITIVPLRKPLKEYFDRYHTVTMDNFRISDQEIVASNCGHTGGECGCVIVQPCGERAS